MKRSLTTFLASAAVLSLVLASTANANMSNGRFNVRTYTMGGDAINMIVKNQSNIWLFPQTISMYPNQAEGIFGGSAGDFPRFGAHWQFNEGSNPFVVGLYFDNASRYNPFTSSPLSSGGVEPLEGAASGAGLLNNHTLNGFYGRNLGGNPFGVNLNVYNSNNESVAFRRALTSIGATVGITVGGGAWDLALDFGTTTWTDESTTGTPAVTADVTTPDGNNYFGLSARRWFPINSKITWVAHGMVHMNKNGWSYPGAGTTTATAEVKKTSADFGLGLNFTPTSKVLAVLDVGFDYNKTTDERDTNGDGTLNTNSSTKVTSFPPNWSAGVDAEVLSWLDLRMGANNWRMVSTFDDINATSTDPTKQSTNKVNTYLGVGLHFGDLEIDAELDPAWVQDGPYFITGDSNSNTFATVAATLHF